MHQQNATDSSFTAADSVRILKEGNGYDNAKAMQFATNAKVEAMEFATDE